jgi:uncharacterized membrane protein YczE
MTSTLRASEPDATLMRRVQSRVGSAVDPFRVGARRRAIMTVVRTLLLAGGAVLIAACVAVQLWNDLGPGPLDVLIGALRAHTGLPLAFAIWLTIGSLTLVAWALGRRPGFGTLAAPLIVGPTVQVIYGWLERFDPPNQLVVKIAIQLTAIGVVGLGAGAIYVSRFGQGAGELLAGATSERSGRSESRIRVLFEATWLAAGALLGGPFGLGTVMVALCIGPAVARGRHTVGQGVAASRRQLAATLRP